MVEQRIFGQVRKPEDRIRYHYSEDQIYQERQDQLISRYGEGLGVAVYDFGTLMPSRNQLKALAEQVVIKADNGSLEEKALALEALLEAVILRTKGYLD